MARRWRSDLNLSPLMILSFTVIIVLGSQVLALYLLLQQPWTGLHLEPDNVSGFVKVTSIDKNSPAAGVIPVGNVLTSIAVADETIPLTTKLYTTPFLHGSFETYKVLLNQQISIYELLASGKPVYFSSIDQQIYSLTPKTHKNLERIPLEFWIFCIIFPAIVLLTSLVWIYKPNIEASAFLFLSCLACYLFNLVGLVNFSKEFFFDENTSYTLFIAQLIFLNIYIPLFFFTTALYPRRLLSYFGFFIIYAVFSFYTVNFYFSWLNLPEWLVAFQALAPFLMGGLMSLIQMNKASTEPIAKAASALIFLSIALPFVLIIFLHILPLYFNRQPLIDYQSIELLVLISFVGIALGIIKFRLFQLEYWWFKISLWLIIGVLIIILDLVLINLLNQPHIYALGFSVLLVGLVYFPVRQWLLARLMPMDALTLQDFLPRFAQDVIQAGDSAQHLEQAWKGILQERFNPSAISDKSIKINSPQLAENGLVLCVPYLTQNRTYYLTGKQRATRLFNKTDIAAATALLKVVQIPKEATEVRENTIRLERNYWLKELDATIGHKLKSLLSETPNLTDQTITKDSLETLEQTIQLSLQDTPFSLKKHLALWQAELENRVAKQAISVAWQLNHSLNNLELSSLQAIELGQFLREAFTNALKHAKPTDLIIDAKALHSTLYFKISHDGCFKAPELWEAGNGLISLKKRITTLQGEMRFKIDAKTGYLCLELEFPLLSLALYE